MLKLRVSTIGNFSKAIMDLRDNKVVMFKGSPVEDDMEIVDYINIYYGNLMSNKIGFVADVQFRELRIWDTEARVFVEDLMPISPDNKYR